MHTTADLQSKEDRCWSELYSSLPLQNSFPEMLYGTPNFVRSGFLIHQGELLNQVMVMAGADPRPSYAPCLVEMSTVYDGFLFLVSNSCTRDFKLPGFLFYAASLVSNPQSHPLPSPEMLEPLNQTSAQPGRRVTPNLIPSVKLGFSLLGLSVLGPLRLLSLLSKAVLTERPLLLTRFERNSNLFYSSQYMCRFMEPFVRRLHLESKSPLLLAWLGIVVENLFLDRQTDSALEASNLNELGIMIQTFWRCDYRCIFKHLPSPFSMLIETFKLPFINLMKYPSRNLKTNGIMTPSPWSGCYHYSPQRFTPKHISFRTITTTRPTTHRILAKAMLLLLPLSLESFVALIHLSTLQSRLTVTTLSAIGFFDVDQSCNQNLTCLSLLLSDCLIALLDYCLMLFIFLFMTLGKVYLCNLFNLLNSGISISSLCMVSI